ncbi:MAG: 2-oxoacid:acceptor oxidoreductase subunit alpha, partial [Calditrichaeota bacterium]
GVKVGALQLYTIWPFDYDLIRQATDKCKSVIVAEMNMGQIVHEVQKAVAPDVKLHTVQRYDGEIITPMQLLEKLEEVL